ncbi:MAG: DUF1570 domain-containing protein [Planctomycetaceae bacterium]|jgi:hypothetical protein|nr:DUF1570 domain-containing protein [Planctomycetaceae bacterium]MBT6156953.1 DUF1570 domain-containing protein [Planctomycetaceae bacterium]MBT6484478.1 DUF1570 domain-containing protein [Planctomycetaceae bacterium]MBT6498144.1 DUF1570 domain-containing protein [Planctomycetaceae bacterium]
MKWILKIVAVTGICFAPVDASAGSDKLLEFLVEGETHQGKVEALGENDCWLLGRDGRMIRLRLNDVKSFRRVEPKFRPYPAAEMRDRLQREFGKEYEVVGSGRYLVCAPRGRAKRYVELFDDIYRTFRVNFGARGFQLSKPEFPMVAIVLRDRKSFHAYQKVDGVPIRGQLLGYYHPVSNRVALFEPGTVAASKDHTDWQSPITALTLPAGFNAFGSIQAGLEDTIIHEATHQVAFNTGLHTRIGPTPRWVVEGLATVFEADGVRHRNTVGVGSAKSRINRGRFIGFQNYVAKRRKSKSLESFIADDTVPGLSALDFYSQSWALSFYLMETRSRQYAGFLKQIAARDPLQPYTAAERVADFKTAVGNDLSRLETGFLRYFDQLK